MTLVAALAILGLTLGPASSSASEPDRQMSRPTAHRSAEVVDGVLRWKDDHSEVALFGVNYYAPFSLDYHSLRILGADHRREIDHDVAHLARLGLDVLRMHVFDREISDADGNLIENEHLDLCDYLIHRCTERGMYVLLTPIAWWPSPNPNGGFSNRYSMVQMTSDPAAVEAQRRYLRQLMAHVNPYTGLSYAQDPTIVAVELINEPNYKEGVTDAEVTAYIDTLAEAVRASGCRKPIFYNGWLGKHAAVRRSTADGCTFSWYPTGLMNGHALYWNVLPLLDRHPEMHDSVLDGKAKAVYEFDAADVPQSCVYPAMARAFRSGGAQMAAQFQYDPTADAAFNLGWQTHYLNLCYTPAKAVSLMIAAEAFRRLPRGMSYGEYARNARFGPFEVDYKSNLSIMRTADRFYYSGSTSRMPPAPASLRHIAGYGSSHVVRYDGSGAYFLDRIVPGVWRLEVYPDAVPTRDPYEQPFIGREVGRLVWRTHRMVVQIADLGDDFGVEAPGTKSGAEVLARNGAISVRPGVYRLTRRGAHNAPTVDERSFWAPADNDEPMVSHTPSPQWQAGKPLPITVSIVAPEEPTGVLLTVMPPGSERVYRRRMHAIGPCMYMATVPAEMVREGTLRYEIRVKDPAGVRGYPGGVPEGATHSERDLFMATPDVRMEPQSNIGPELARKVALVAGPNGAGNALRMETNGPLPRRVGGDTNAADGWLSVGSALSMPVEAHSAGSVAVCLRSVADTSAVQVGLAETSGVAFATDVPVTRGWRVAVIPLYRFVAVDRRGEGRTIRTIGSLWFSLLGRLTRGSGPQSVDIAWVRLRAAEAPWEVSVAPHSASVPLYVASRNQVWTGNPIVHHEYMVTGMSDASLALRITAANLGAVVGFRRDCTDYTSVRCSDLASMHSICVRARWVESRSSAVQVALIEQDGTPWGADVALTSEWRDVRVPLSKLRYLREWAIGPAGRGSAGDHVRLDRLAAVNLCFGAWLDPQHVSEPHTLEIEEIALEP